jgi:hypothetical protein
MLLLLSISVLVACQKEMNKGPLSTEAPTEYIRVKEEIKEYFDSNMVTTEKTEFIYEKADDYFWKKAVTRDESGKVIKELDRTFDADRFPVAVRTLINGELTESAETKYCHRCFDLLEKTFYDGELKDGKKKKRIINKYDEDFLVSQSVEEYSYDSEFKNEDGTKLLRYYKLVFGPAKQNRYQGDATPFYFIETMKEYTTCKGKDEAGNPCKHGGECVYGELSYVYETMLNADGYPYYIRTTEPDCKEGINEEWYNIAKDGNGNVKTMTGYANRKLDSLVDGNVKISFTYDKQGKLASREEYKYNKVTKKFDRFHNSKNFDWVESPLKGNFKLADYQVEGEAFCWCKKAHSFNKTVIAKYDSNEKIVENWYGTKDPLDHKTVKSNEMVSRITTKYDVWKMK